VSLLFLALLNGRLAAAAEGAVPRPDVASPAADSGVAGAGVAGAVAASPESASPDFPVTLIVGLGASLGPAGLSGSGGLSGGGDGAGRILVHYRKVALDLGARTGLDANDLREVTGISAGLRWSPGRPYLRLGFVHFHETPWDVLKAQPVMATLGSAVGIRHRSGGELALGVQAPVLPVETHQRFGAYAEAAVMAFPDDSGPPLYGGVELGLCYAVGKDRSGR